VCVALLAIVVAHRAFADLAIGDKPTLQFTAVDGSDVDLKQLRGKIVVVSFWSVSDAGRLQQRRIVELSREHADDGVAMIGICCDRDLTRAQAMAAELGMRWPQYWDGQMWNGRICQEWGCSHLTSVLVAPDGKVLWTGTATLLDKRLNDALIAFPPTMVDPEVLTKANQAMDALEKTLKDPSAPPSAALSEFAQVPPDATKNKPLANRMDAVMPQLTDLVKQALAPADDLIAQHRNLDAVNRLNDLAKDLKGTLAEREITDRLRSLRDDPETKAQMEQAAREQTAQEALTAARRLRDSEQHTAAYQHLKAVVTDYPHTAAAASAAELIAAYEMNAPLMEKIHREINAAKAESMLSIARNYAATKMNDQARQKYRAIMEQFPGTEQAATGKREMDALGAN
jgi:hypothetical protein